MYSTKEKRGIKEQGFSSRSVEMWKNMGVAGREQMLCFIWG